MKIALRKKIFILTLLVTSLYTLCVQAEFTKAKNLYKSEKNSIKKELKISKELLKSKHYYSSLLFMKSYLSEVNKLPAAGTKKRKMLEKMLEILILKTGTMAFSYMPKKILRKYTGSPSISLAMAVDLTEKGRYQRALKLLKKIDNSHRFSPEARMIEGASYVLVGNIKKAKNSYKACRASAEKFKENAEHEKLKRYYGVISNSCLLHTARIHYQKDEFKKADKIYENIPKSSYRWPYTLIEQAWTHYNLNDFNRSLGILVTYKSPLLKSYFMPEAEVLRALSYYKLCLWEDAERVIQHYYNYYNKKSQQLKKILQKHKSSNKFFLKMALTPIRKNEDKNIFMRNLLTQIRKTVKYNIDLVSYKRLRNEIQQLQKIKGSELKKRLLKELKIELKFRITHLNSYVKKSMFEFINEMHRFSYEMFNIKLEISSQKRNLVYENKELISDRSRGDLSHVNREKGEYFFDFRGEFWADELGDYSFGLKSNCQKVKSKETVTWN